MKTTDKKNTTANIKWRHHEITLVTACLVMLAAGYFMNIHQTSMDQLATGFIANGAAFDLYKNVILPDVGLAISAFAVYLVINLYIVPRLIINLETGTSDKKKFSFSSWAQFLILQHIININGSLITRGFHYFLIRIIPGHKWM